MTPEQREAATYLWQAGSAQALQVIAGAGSGKTHTLVQTLVEAKKAGINPGKIALFTFTRKAASEMKERMSRLGASNLAGFVGTMHSFAYRAIFSNDRKHSAAQTKPRFIAHPAIVRAGIARRLFPEKAHIPADVLVQTLNPAEQTNLEKAYEQYKESKNQMDLDDLIIKAAQLFENRFTDFKAKPVSGPDYLLIDEFQDTSPEQIRLIRAIAPKKLFAVGDDWQSIYRFRGADVTVSLRFFDYFPSAKRLYLTRNFRSTSRIVKFGNRAIRQSKEYLPKKLRAFHGKLMEKYTGKGRGKKPRCFILSKPVLPPVARPAFTQTPAAGFIESAWLRAMAHLQTEWPRYQVLVRTNEIRHRIEPLLPPEVGVMTIHAAKGLEFERVLVFGVASGIFPHRWNNFDEEVRLLYVAASRAKKELAFLAWENRDRYSEFMPFLAENCRLIYLDDLPPRSRRDRACSSAEGVIVSPPIIRANS